ncbi:ethanolamine ammonia-lyase subunit EutC [Agarivorans sp. Alg241-V36]|uniref:ethanolamine ammonia-lyase subunit EutC n=1 Tax=Agarivorans sp. Alg241-V36 TaxID=2305992 RepID=UPI0013D770D4|nr:ethanolamine ammonia-lyase subunit EutC [Agarivorans sp. Alg241-V36]
MSDSKPASSVEQNTSVITSDEFELVTANPWQVLKAFTDARIALGRAGSSLPTQAHLQFQLDHAKARDAVLTPLDYSVLIGRLAGFNLGVQHLQSQAGSRAEYLQRPDLGRRLNKASYDTLAKHNNAYDIALVVTEGLSSRAISENAEALLAALIPKLKGLALSIAPIVVVEQGRVGVGDDVAQALGVKMVAILVGERPGLSSPDSLGIYFTYQAYPGIEEAKRNCLSNIRQAGMSVEDAAFRLSYLIEQANKLGYSGVALKDKSQMVSAKVGKNFLLPEAP